MSHLVDPVTVNTALEQKSSRSNRISVAAEQLNNEQQDKTNTNTVLKHSESQGLNFQVVKRSAV